MRYLAATLALALIGAGSTIAAANPPPAKFVRQADHVAGSYIVVMKPTTHRAALNASIDTLATRHTATVGHRYSTVLDGFVAQMSETDALALAADPAVDHVEEDGIAHGDAIESAPTWGLDRLDQPALPLDAAYSQVRQGAGATVYVIDSGIHPTHTEFTGRLLPGISFVADALGTGDCSGHGTHVAGTIGGTTFGVAKEARLVAVRVLDCNTSGSISNIIAGIDWVAAHHLAGSIANLSIGSVVSDAEDAAVGRLIASGVAVVTSAGNQSTDACTQSPARAHDAITVAATTDTDSRAAFSNFGTCVDLFAPGELIRSAGIASDTASQVMSGTSMAVPHVAGIAALFLAVHPSATPGQVAEALLGHAVHDTVLDTEGSPNLMVNSTFIDQMTDDPGMADAQSDTMVAPDQVAGCSSGRGGAGFVLALAMVGFAGRLRRARRT